MIIDKQFKYCLGLLSGIEVLIIRLTLQLENGLALVGCLTLMLIAPFH